MSCWIWIVINYLSFSCVSLFFSSFFRDTTAHFKEVRSFPSQFQWCGKEVSPMCTRTWWRHKHHMILKNVIDCVSLWCWLMIMFECLKNFLSNKCTFTFRFLRMFHLYQALCRGHQWFSFISTFKSLTKRSCLSIVWTYSTSVWHQRCFMDVLMVESMLHQYIQSLLNRWPLQPARSTLKINIVSVILSDVKSVMFQWHFVIWISSISR